MNGEMSLQVKGDIFEGVQFGLYRSYCATLSRAGCMPLLLHLRLLSYSLILFLLIYSCALLYKVRDLLFDALVVQTL